MFFYFLKSKIYIDSATDISRHKTMSGQYKWIIGVNVSVNVSLPLSMWSFDGLQTGISVWSWMNEQMPPCVCVCVCVRLSVFSCLNIQHKRRKQKCATLRLADCRSMASVDTEWLGLHLYPGGNSTLCAFVSASQCSESAHSDPMTSTWILKKLCRVTQAVPLCLLQSLRKFYLRAVTYSVSSPLLTFGYLCWLSYLLCH